jgi:DHA1 family tetracycline resistance protein-like MFS transporter
MTSAGSHKAPYAIIFLTVFIDLVGFGIVIPVLPLYAERFGATPLIIGCLVGIYSLMQWVCAPLLGKLSDRIGRRPVLLVSIIGTSLGFLVMGWAPSLAWLFVARIIDGITGGNISTAQAYIADITPPHERSKAMGLIGAAFGLGFVLGPALGGVLSHFSLTAPFLFAAALAACNAVALFFLLPESLSPQLRRQAGRGASLREVLAHPKARALRTILAAYFFTTVAFSLLTATYALFTERRFGFTATQIGYIFACMGLAGALIQGVLLGRLLKHLSDKPLIIAGSAILGASLWLLPLASTTGALFAVTAGLAIGHSLMAAPLSGLASKAGEAQSQGRILGLLQSSASLARIIGPVLGGWLLHYDVFSPERLLGSSPYWIGAAVMAVAFLLATRL